MKNWFRRNIHWTGNYTSAVCLCIFGSLVHRMFYPLSRMYWVSLKLHCFFCLFLSLLYCFCMHHLLSCMPTDICSHRILFFVLFWVLSFSSPLWGGLPTTAKSWWGWSQSTGRLRRPQRCGQSPTEVTDGRPLPQLLASLSRLMILLKWRVGRWGRVWE